MSRQRITTKLRKNHCFIEAARLLDEMGYGHFLTFFVINLLTHITTLGIFKS